MAKGKKKANGEGNINPRKSGGYYAQLTWNHERKTVSGKTYEECRRKLDELKHLRDKGMARVKNGKITVGELALYYYLTVKPHIKTETGTIGIKNSTWNWHMDNVKWYIEKELSNIPITKFNREIAQKFFDGLSDGAYISDTTNEPIILSANSVKGVKRTLNPVMKYAMQESYILKNPLEFVVNPEARKRPGCCNFCCNRPDRR